jgi:hypothetical protein
LITEYRWIDRMMNMLALVGILGFAPPHMQHGRGVPVQPWMLVVFGVAIVVMIILALRNGITWGRKS